MSIKKHLMKERIRVRADGRCEYCKHPDEMDNELFLECDHIHPSSLDGSDEDENLAYACRTCNNLKGAQIVAYDLTTREEFPLFDPRTMKWDEHFQWIDLEILGKTSIGRATVQLLKFNTNKRLRVRNASRILGLFAGDTPSVPPAGDGG